LASQYVGSLSYVPMAVPTSTSTWTRRFAWHSYPVAMYHGSLFASRPRPAGVPAQRHRHPPERDVHPPARSPR